MSEKAQTIKEHLASVKKRGEKVQETIKAAGKKKKGSNEGN